MTAAPTLSYERRPSALAYMLRGAMPAAHRAQSRPLLVARWPDHRVDAKQLAAFLQVTGLPASRRLPILYPHVFGFRLSMALLTHPAFPVPIWGVVQTRNHLLSHRGVDADEVLDFAVSVSERRVLEKGQELDLHTRVRVGAELVWESLVTFFARGRFGAPTGASPLAQAPSDFGHPAAAWKMSNDAHCQFGHFTGDYNGIHLWDWYARRFGFRGALYHPPRLLGQCLARLPTPEGGGPERLDAWLKGPVLHGAEVSLRHAASGEVTTFALFADAERPSIVGRLGPVPARSRLVEGDRENT